ITGEKTTLTLSCSPARPIVSGRCYNDPRPVLAHARSYERERVKRIRQQADGQLEVTPRHLDRITPLKT
ncbi:MAG: hypothetical protein ACREH8_10215, partial [Opitutaceae bacterium]